ncbi:gp53-like domain-containing protein [Pseudomonas muyukensis]|uniref:Putative tail fiber protein gp53-like C-terminal domain-containing protein n=1 Tax=Pseudomonas muyukensis TaxID=2842357 RepID=A0ABX8M3F2_9PSED|nr:hypothetical protein [Pseudomonas muyukensis]QXH33118.1 hypothetical protein KSS95_13050 [Pseudomonas muyukensis]
MDYPKRIPNVGLVDGKFVDENASTGQPGSLIPATWGNAVTDELLAVIKAAGIVPTEDDNAQVLKAIQGIAASDIKRAVRVTTTGPIALSGLQTIDGVMLQAGDRVLVKDQANAAQNWIYTASGGAWARALDASADAQCTPGHVIIVQAGANLGGSLWQLTNSSPPQVGTTSLNFGLVFGRTGIAIGSYRQVSVDVMGRVTAGSNPTTLAGHGITDAYTKDEVGQAFARKADTLGGYGIADAYTKTQTDSLLAGKASKATTLAGYGITDALKRGDSGLGVPILPAASDIDWIYLNSGFHVMGAGANGLANYCSVLHMPYVSEGYAAQLAVLQGQADVEVRVRACKAPGVWGPTRRVLTDADQATVPMALAGTDDRTWLSPAKLWSVLNAKLFGGFSLSLGVNGYLVFPSWLSGLIFQWGRVANAAPSGTGVSLALAFPNACISANCSAIGNLATQVHEVAEIFSITQTAAVVSNSGGGSVSWFAIGY